MPSYSPPNASPTFATVLKSFALDDGLPFANVLTQEQIDHACREHGVAFATGTGDVWTPALTLWTFLTQCLSASKSCVAAVARALVLRVALGLPPCDAATGAYCKARAKLPEGFLRHLTYQVGDALEAQAPAGWQWHGRRVLLADGTQLSMPDTPANQQAYPQPPTQKPGLGFPMIRLVVLLTFATAALVGAAVGPCQGDKTGETALLHALLERIAAGDVVVADRYYCTWWLVALLQERGADVAFRLHASRHYDFRRGRRLGRGDHVVTWPKPEKPEWMDTETYARLPAELTIREVRVTVTQRGSRVQQFVVATTLTDVGSYPASSIADLYHQRWHVELDIRNIKQTLKMDILSCKSPEMVRREIWAHLLCYNLVRQVLAAAALAVGKTPRQLSFAGAVQTCDAFRWLLVCGGGVDRGQLVQALLLAIGTHVVGNRPGRVEPREVKRRRKVRLLMKPRQQRRAELLRESEAAQK